MRKKEVSRRPFTDNIWEITYEGGGIGFEGTPSKESDPIVPMDIPGPKIQPIAETKQAKPVFKEEDIVVSGKSRRLKIGVDISKKNAIDLVRLDDSLDKAFKEQLLEDLENDDVDSLDLGI